MTQYLMSVYMTEGDETPSPEAMEKMYKDVDVFNNELKAEGAWVFAGGLEDIAATTTVDASKGETIVTDGPFAESKELVGGFYIVDVKSREEAIAWALRCPSGLGFDDVLEIRALTGESDIPPNLRELIKTAAPTWSASSWCGRI